jgi:hypothetical protein
MSNLVIKTIKVKLTDAEKSTYAYQAAKAEMAIELIEEERKALNSQIKNHKGQRHELLKCIENGEEERSIECTVENDFDGNEVRYIYNGEVVDSRPMEESDRQLDLEKSKKVIRRGRKKVSTGGDVVSIN